MKFRRIFMSAFIKIRQMSGVSTAWRYGMTGQMHSETAGGLRFWSHSRRQEAPGQQSAWFAGMRIFMWQAARRCRRAWSRQVSWPTGRSAQSSPRRSIRRRLRQGLCRASSIIFIPKRCTWPLMTDRPKRIPRECWTY